MSNVKKSWLPIGLPSDIKELEDLWECENRCGDATLAAIQLKYLTHLKKERDESKKQL